MWIIWIISSTNNYNNFIRESNYSKETVEEWDSVHQLSLIAEFEEAFDIMFDPEDIMEMTSYAKGKEILAKYDVTL